MRKKNLNAQAQVDKLSAEQLRLVKNYFRNCDRIGAVAALHFKKTKNRIEVYDIGNRTHVGAIYPDGACMIWPRSWYTGNKDIISISEDDMPFNVLFNEYNDKKINTRSRMALREIKPKRARVKLITQRVKLND